MTDNTSPVAHAPLPYECFRDASYYDMWCVRRVNDREFGKGFHLVNGEEAAALRDLLNTRAPSHSDLVEALRAVEAAMIRGGDGRILDVGWNITKLNEARPMIRAILTKAEAGHG